MALLHLGPDDEPGCPAHMSAAAIGASPRLGGESRPDPGRHQRVPGRVELHFVNAFALGVVAAQDRDMPVGLVAHAWAWRCPRGHRGP